MLVTSRWACPPTPGSSSSRKSLSQLRPARGLGPSDREDGRKVGGPVHVECLRRRIGPLGSRPEGARPIRSSRSRSGRTRSDGRRTADDRRDRWLRPTSWQSGTPAPVFSSPRDRLETRGQGASSSRRTQKDSIVSLLTTRSSSCRPRHGRSSFGSRSIPHSKAEGRWGSSDITPDGSTLLAVGGLGAGRCDSLARCPVPEVRRSAINAFEGAPKSAALSPDGLLLAIGASDGFLRVWDTRDGSLVQRSRWATSRCRTSRSSTTNISR